MTMEGGELRLLRRNAGMSQQELAVALDLPAGRIGRMERGLAPIDRVTELAARHVLRGPAGARRKPATRATPDAW